jgi:hypothetical protein
MAQRKSPREIKPVLEALAQTEAVVIGGQAVNLDTFTLGATHAHELKPRVRASGHHPLRYLFPGNNPVRHLA